jgi:hypothetical protein
MDGTPVDGANPSDSCQNLCSAENLRGRASFGNSDLHQSVAWCHSRKAVFVCLPVAVLPTEPGSEGAVHLSHGGSEVNAAFPTAGWLAGGVRVPLA